MTTTIKTRCDGCHEELELTPSEVSLMICDQPRYSYYEHDCTLCGETTRRHADQFTIGLLISGTVVPIVWAMPAEALEPKTGSVLTYDDLLDFVLELERNDILTDKELA